MQCESFESQLLERKGWLFLWLYLDMVDHELGLLVFSWGNLFCSLSGNHLYEHMEKNGNHPKEDFGKFGYKPEMKYNSLINLLYLWLHTENYNGLHTVIWRNCALLINTATTFFFSWQNSIFKNELILESFNCQKWEEKK